MKFTFEMRSLAEDILARANEDWVSPAEVISICRRSGIHDAENLRDLAIGLIGRLLANDLLVAGDIEPGVGHRPWDCTPGQAINRIIMEWCSYSDPFEVRMGEIAWLAVTLKGHSIGEAVIRREAG